LKKHRAITPQIESDSEAYETDFEEGPGTQPSEASNIDQSPPAATKFRSRGSNQCFSPKESKDQESKEDQAHATSPRESEAKLATPIEVKEDDDAVESTHDDARSEKSAAVDDDDSIAEEEEQEEEPCPKLKVRSKGLTSESSKGQGGALKLVNVPRTTRQLKSIKASPRQPSGSPVPNQKGNVHKRVARSPAGKSPQRLIVSSLASRVGNAPLDLSISEFMPRQGYRYESKEIRAELKLTVADDILKGHAKFQGVAEERLEEVEHVLDLWQSGEANAAFEYLEHLANPSVTHDVCNSLNLRNGQTATLDVCAAALPSLVTLIGSSFEDHIKLGLSLCKFLFDSFSGIIRTTLLAKQRAQGSRSSVDVSREERSAKCENCLASFIELAKHVEALSLSHGGDQSPMARTKREAENLAAKIQSLSSVLA